MNNLTIAGAMCGAFSLFCCIGAVASPRWLAADLLLGEVCFGLWNHCYKDYETGYKGCWLKDMYPVWAITTIILEIGGAFLIFADVLLATQHMCVPRYNQAFGKGTGLYAITGGLIIAIGAIVWAVKYMDDQGLAMCRLSAGFSLAILSAVMSIITGSFLLLGWRAEPREHSYTAL